MRIYHPSRYIDIVASPTTNSGVTISDQQIQDLAGYIASHITISGITDQYDFEGQDGISVTESGRVVYIDNEFIDGGLF